MSYPILAHPNCNSHNKRHRGLLVSTWIIWNHIQTRTINPYRKCPQDTANFWKWNEINEMSDAEMPGQLYRFKTRLYCNKLIVSLELEGWLFGSFEIKTKLPSRQLFDWRLLLTCGHRARGLQDRVHGWSAAVSTSRTVLTKIYLWPKLDLINVVSSNKISV